MLSPGKARHAITPSGGSTEPRGCGALLFCPHGFWKELRLRHDEGRRCPRQRLLNGWQGRLWVTEGRGQYPIPAVSLCGALLREHT
jgi:hypothetical protein